MPIERPATPIPRPGTPIPGHSPTEHSWLLSESATVTAGRATTVSCTSDISGLLRVARNGGRQHTPETITPTMSDHQATSDNEEDPQLSTLQTMKPGAQRPRRNHRLRAIKFHTSDLRKYLEEPSPEHVLAHLASGSEALADLERAISGECYDASLFSECDSTPEKTDQLNVWPLDCETQPPRDEFHIPRSDKRMTGNVRLVYFYAEQERATVARWIENWMDDIPFGAPPELSDDLQDATGVQSRCTWYR